MYMADGPVAEEQVPPTNAQNMFMADDPDAEEQDSDDDTRQYPGYPPLKEDKTSKSNGSALMTTQKKIKALPDGWTAKCSKMEQQ